MNAFYRTSEPIELWSGIIRADNMPFADFEEHVRAIAVKSQQRITGFTIGSESAIQSFTMTRYPRKKYGVTPVAACIANGTALAERLSSSLEIDKSYGIRIVLGLREGYETNAVEHGIDDIRSSVEPYYRASRAQVFALRPDGQDYSVYTEPVAVVRGEIDKTEHVYGLANELKQERFTVENFEESTAFMVETPHCKEPDLV